MPTRIKESEAATKLVKALNIAGFRANKIVASTEQTSGLPDIIGCTNHGIFVAIEVKIIEEPHYVFPYSYKQILRLQSYNKLCAVSLGVAVLAFKHKTILIDTNLDAYADEKFESYESFAGFMVNYCP